MSDSPAFHPEDIVTSATEGQRYRFSFDPAYRVAGLPFGVTPRTTHVEVDERLLRVRFGPWRLETLRSNIVGASLTGDYAFLKTAGPPHLSFADKGVTFATNRTSGLCLELAEPVRGLDPTGRLKHPGLTVTVVDAPLLLDWATSG